MENKSILDKFLNVFTTNKYVYETNQSIETLRSKIEFLINQKEYFNAYYNLTGHLNRDNSFKLTRRAGLILIGSGGGNPVTIKGILRNKLNSTEVEIEVKPNFVFVLYTVVFGLIGMGFLVNFIFTQKKETLFGAFFLIAVPIMMWALAKGAKIYYKSEFEKALDLPANELILRRTIKL